VQGTVYATRTVGTAMNQQLTKDAIRVEIEATRTAFHALSRSLSAADRLRRSKNVAWTNGEVLFHITFAFMLLPALLTKPIVAMQCRKRNERAHDERRNARN